MKNEEIGTAGSADALQNTGCGFFDIAGFSIHSGAGFARPYLLFLIS
jgi:hypothetical protein